MLQTFFLWYYRLPLVHVVLSLLVLGAVYRLLHQRLGKKRWWLPLTALLLLICLHGIFSATLTGRIPDAVSAKPEWIPFRSLFSAAAGEKELLRESLMNVALFYPAGMLTCGLLPEGWSRSGRLIFIVLLFASLSAGIEFCQFRYALGLAETDDVIHNAIGALIGAAVCLAGSPGKSKAP